MAHIETEYDLSKCQCCGADATQEMACVCTGYPEWMMTENGDVACGYHKPLLFVKPESKTIAMGVPALESNDRWRNYRNPNLP